MRSTYIKAELQPITEVTDVKQLAERINSHVKTPRGAHLLYSRHLLGVLQRHSDTEAISEVAMRESQRLHAGGELGVYVVKCSAEYIGMATVDPRPQLKRQRVSMPPKFAYGPLSSTITPYGPEVTAWMAQTHDARDVFQLSSVYEALKDPKGIASAQFEAFARDQEPTEPVRAWTIEPLDAPQWIRSGIRQAGFVTQKQDVGYYDDAESRRISPPQSRLYIAPAVSA